MTFERRLHCKEQTRKHSRQRGHRCKRLEMGRCWVCVRTREGLFWHTLVPRSVRGPGGVQLERNERSGHVGCCSVSHNSEFGFILRTVGNLGKGVKWLELQWLKKKQQRNTLSTVERMDWQGVRIEEERAGWRLSPEILWCDGDCCLRFVFVFGASLIWILPTLPQLLGPSGFYRH